jgi:putative alpha-1,2-mannosidase
MSALGFYSVDPVSGNYVFGSPLVDRAEVDLGQGKKLKIEVKRSSPSAAYIQSLTLSGKPHHKLWFRHADMKDGAVIEFAMASEPTQFGTSEDATPPSLSEEAS